MYPNTITNDRKSNNLSILSLSDFNDERKFGSKSLPENKLLKPIKKINFFHEQNLNHTSFMPDNILHNNEYNNLDSIHIDSEKSDVEEQDCSALQFINVLIKYNNIENNKKKLLKQNRMLKYIRYNDFGLMETKFLNPYTYFKFYDYRFPYNISFLNKDKSRRD